MLIKTKIFWITYFLNAFENGHIKETYSLQAILNEPYSNFDDFQDKFSLDEEYFCNNEECHEYNIQEVSFIDNKNGLISNYV